MNSPQDFANWASGRGIHLSPAQLQQFEAYKANLLDWNTRVNLTAITDNAGVWQKHFADSLTLWPWLEAAQTTGTPARFIDVGTGAGFPGLPVKIAWPDVFVTVGVGVPVTVNTPEAVAA